MAKINKLTADWSQFHRVGIYVTTFANDVKRTLKRDEIGFYFILNKEKERITDLQDIERIEQFLNIK